MFTCSLNEHGRAGPGTLGRGIPPGGGGIHVPRWRAWRGRGEGGGFGSISSL